jgi:hypothetical protein
VPPARFLLWMHFANLLLLCSIWTRACQGSGGRKRVVGDADASVWMLVAGARDPAQLLDRLPCCQRSCDQPAELPEPIRVLAPPRPCSSRKTGAWHPVLRCLVIHILSAIHMCLVCGNLAEESTVFGVLLYLRRTTCMFARVELHIMREKASEFTQRT